MTWKERRVGGLERAGIRRRLIGLRYSIGGRGFRSERGRRSGSHLHVDVTTRKKLENQYNGIDKSPSSGTDERTGGQPSGATCETSPMGTTMRHFLMNGLSSRD